VIVADTPAEQTRSRKRTPTCAVIAVLSLCGTVVALQQTMVVPLLPDPLLPDFLGILGISPARYLLAGHRDPAHRRGGNTHHVQARRHVRQTAENRDGSS
jgi:hypothetical protein